MAMTDSQRLAVVAGSFDPLTNGHLDLISRARTLFPRVVVAVLINPAKHPVFSLEDRVAMLREAVADRGWDVEIDTFEGLLADYVRRRGASAIVRGLRTAGEFSYESPIALMNRHLESSCETVFVVPGADVAHISSTLVREIASLRGPVDGLVPAGVASRLVQRFTRS
jgi:pantetheine-phosphate adenylyltransferase